MPLTLLWETEFAVKFAEFPSWMQIVWYTFMPVLYGISFFTPTWVTLLRMLSLSLCIHYSIGYVLHTHTHPSPPSFSSSIHHVPYKAL